MRLKQAREQLGWTQQRCADKIGIERGTLTNYEYLKSPVRYEVALRFCRALIVSEEWLATGEHKSLRSIAREKFSSIALQSNWREIEKTIFFRQCVDLLSEPIVRSVPPGALFSFAYDEFLAARYAEIARDFFYAPRIVFTDTPETQVARSLLDALVERWFELLHNEGLRLSADWWLAQRNFMRGTFEFGTALFAALIKNKLNIPAVQPKVAQAVAKISEPTMPAKRSKKIRMRELHSSS